MRRSRASSARATGRTRSTAPSGSVMLSRLSGELWAQDDAGGGGVSIQRTLQIGELAFGGCSAAPQVEYFAFGADLAGLAGERAHIVDFNLQRGIANASGQQRMDGAAQR